MEFFKCEHCGNITTFVVNKGVPIVCCGQKMMKLDPNTSDGALEKHVPVIEIDGNKVTVSIGEVAHPMTKEHFIEAIALETKKSKMIVNLKPDEEAKAYFVLSDGDEVVSAYEYCNLHGLWKK